jgi:carbon storage regulator CsrA
MLALERVVDSAVWIGQHIRIQVLAVRGRRVRLGISAPQAVQISREELLSPARAHSDGPAVAPTLKVTGIEQAASRTAAVPAGPCCPTCGRSLTIASVAG